MLKANRKKLTPARMLIIIAAVSTRGRPCDMISPPMREMPTMPTGESSVRCSPRKAAPNTSGTLLGNATMAWPTPTNISPTSPADSATVSVPRSLAKWMPRKPTVSTAGIRRPLSS